MFSLKEFKWSFVFRVHFMLLLAIFVKQNVVVYVGKHNVFIADYGAYFT